MKNILTAMIERLEANKSSLGLSYIDEEYGQVEALDDESREMYAPTFPAVLVDCSGETWQQAGNGMQSGSVTVNVNIYLDCYDDTHAFSTTIGKVSERMRLVRCVTELFQGFKVLPECGSMVRASSQTSTINHGIKMYQVSFALPAYESFYIGGSVAVNGMEVKASLKR